MPPPALNKFHKRLDGLEKTRKRMDGLHYNGRIKGRDSESMHEALFLRAVTSFESFFEELFLGILQGRPAYKRRDILFKNESGLQCRPYGDIVAA